MKRKKKKKATYCMVSFTRLSQKGKTVGTENRTGVARIWQKITEFTIKRQNGTSEGVKSILYLDCGYMTE